VSADFWLWLDTVLMTAGGLAILAIGKRRTKQEEAHTIYHGIVPIIAACSYFAMAVAQGAVVLPTADGGSRLFYFARYIDWTFTTPLLLLSLAGTAMHSGHRRGGLVAGLILSDVMMILTSLFFGASEVIWIKWTWFLISCIAFLGVYYVMWVGLLEENRKETAHVQSDYRRNATILTVLWFAYPVILALSTDGLGSISTEASVALIAIIDLVSKVAYGLLTTAGMTKIVDEELGSTNAVGHAPQRVAA
jgi:bacteriorhodopsin